MEKIIIAAVTAITIAAGVSMLYENAINIEAIKAGLQQCVVKMDVRNYVVWKKECGKGE